MPKGLIFDFNGVMVDDYPLQKEAWSEISNELRSKPVTDEEMVNKIRGVPSRDTIKWMSHDSLTLDEVKAMANRKDSIIEDLAKTSPLFRLADGLSAFLDACEDRAIPRSIVTSSAPDIIRFSFERLGLGQWFKWEHVLSNDGSYPGKPAPDPYLLGAKLIGLKPIECIVFEDALSGVKAAHAAGVFGVVVIGREKQLKEFAELPGVIKTARNFVGLEPQALLA